MGVIKSAEDEVYENLGGFVTKELCDYVLEDLTPPLGAERIFPDSFGKYGFTISGISDGWKWYEDKVKSAPKTDLLIMISIANTYWLNKYMKWYEEKK